MEIKCAEGVIDIISANYGRLSKTECVRKGIESKVFDRTNCSHSDSTDELKKRCNAKEQCILEIFRILVGDPCKGIEKYLEAEFQCVDVTSK